MNLLTFLVKVLHQSEMRIVTFSAHNQMRNSFTLTKKRITAGC